jgi:hypothetical protein
MQDQLAAHRIVADPVLRFRFNPDAQLSASPLKLPETTAIAQPFVELSLPHYTETTEREVTYLARRSYLEQALNFESLRKADIFQAYFPKKLLHELVVEVASKYAGDIGYSLDAFNSARVRRTIEGDKVSYSLEIKGPKRGGWRAKIARAEVILPITRERFYELLPSASRGFIDKTRYSVPGRIWSAKRGTIEVTAHIDLIHGTGRVRDGNRIWRWKSNKVDFSKIDIEIPSRKFLRALRNGNHDFEFLKNDSVEITALRRRDRQVLSTARLARNGIDRKVRKTISRAMAA